MERHIKSSPHRGFLHTFVGFDMFSGERPGGHFLQKEAWEGRQCCVDSVLILVEAYSE